MEQLKQENVLKNYHLLDATLGQLHVDAGIRESARAAFIAAKTKTSSDREQAFLGRKLDSLN